MQRKQGPPVTTDGRYVIIAGRRWRATDPTVPEDAAARLRIHLMDARRAVGAARKAEDPRAERRARHRVHAAKVALGERGEPWWDQDSRAREARWREGLAALDEHADPADHDV
ncbi:hypothetical protein [Streptomyces sp. NPDC097619]|uniref:hypothetical protein n=1 Tax=Streptomyces sp. NPDC097619 TaxID=3157228 RepID=UPI00332111E9